MLTESLDSHAVKVDGKVGQSAAHITLKVAMLGQYCVISSFGIARVHDTHQPGIEKGMQGVVDRGLGQSRHDPDKALVDLIGSWVSADLPKVLKDLEPLI
jgi:hypothetical protein